MLLMTLAIFLAGLTGMRASSAVSRSGGLAGLAVGSGHSQR